MAELLALPAVTAAPTPGAMLSGLIDTTPSMADPFAACLADAQAGPAVAVTQPVPAILSVLPTAANDGPPARQIDADKPAVDTDDAPEDDKPTPLIDPAISPALAMLTALISPDVQAPPVVASAPKRMTGSTGRIGQANPRAEEIGGGPSSLPIPIELLVQAAASPVKPMANEAPQPAEMAEPVAIEEAAAAAAAPVQTKARPQVPPAAKDGAPVATAKLRPADGAEQPPISLRRVVERAAPQLEPIAPLAPALLGDIAHTDIAAAVPVTDQLVQRQLVIADDGRWLDGLARDIAQSASGDTLRFKLEPVNLGSLTVAIAQGSDGAAIRLTAETHRARDLLIDAQPALVAEARANGLRISETHVDLGDTRSGGGNAPSGGQQSFANASTGQQAMRQDARRQPDLPNHMPTQPRSPAARAPAQESGERFA